MDHRKPQVVQRLVRAVVAQDQLDVLLAEQQRYLDAAGLAIALVQALQRQHQDVRRALERVFGACLPQGVAHGGKHERYVVAAVQRQRVG